MFEAMFGGAFGGGGPPPGRGGRQRRPQKGPTSEVELEVTLEMLFLGVEKGKGRFIEVERERKCGQCKGLVAVAERGALNAARR